MIVLSTTSLASGSLQFQPATGFYICPGVGMVCNVKGCNDGTSDKCSTIANGFDSSLIDGVMVYTSIESGADLSITATEDTAIKCDDACQCQLVTKDLGGCTVPPSNMLDDFFKVGMITSDDTDNINQANGESKAERAVAGAGGLVVVSAFIMTLALNML